MHILDYFKKRNLHETIATFKHECKVFDKASGEGSCAQHFCGPFHCKPLSSLLLPPGVQPSRPHLGFCLSGGQFSGTFTYHRRTPPSQSVLPHTARCASVSCMLTTHLTQHDRNTMPEYSGVVSAWARSTCRPQVTKFTSCL